MENSTAQGRCQNCRIGRLINHRPPKRIRPLGVRRPKRKAGKLVSPGAEGQLCSKVWRMPAGRWTTIQIKSMKRFP
ncbi:hypothetical protein Taro_027807 [Colocasia esculenta]|uniref:Uncharacterized protein n=1 Tax=Colocasia esculenta TaxID=4460 RepID=A0A843V9P3_COLES|nr:hypothetical protein [Colocasia esculenta]